MMGKQLPPQAKLFYYGLCLEERIPADHLLRQIRTRVDFDFTYDLVQKRYGRKGNVSVPPPVILKLMLLLFLYDVPSERELMRTLPYRLDWLWFLGYDLDSVIPDHSVLSKARSRWGTEVFETIFARGVSQCVQAGLVNGRKIHVDGSLIDANASNNSVCQGPEVLIERLRRELRGELVKLEEPEPSSPTPSPPAGTDPAPATAPSEASSPTPGVSLGAGVPPTQEPPVSADAPSAASVAAAPRNGTKKYYQPKNRGMVSTTDPDAAMVRKGSLGPRARYKQHRAVDDLCGVITAVETTAGDVEENARLLALVDQHQQNTACLVNTVVADTQYGTVENYRACQQRGIVSHMADFSLAQAHRPQNQGIFGSEQFVYDPATDTYRCPAGQTLTRRKHKKQRQAYEYACAASICQACTMRGQCTRAQEAAARTIKRHYDQEAIDAAREQAHSQAAKQDRRRRKWRMEGSFGDAATHHGFKRARWRRLWRQQIQDWLIATVQNLRTLLRHAGRRTRGACSPAAFHTVPAPRTFGALADALAALVARFRKSLGSASRPGTISVVPGVCGLVPSLRDHFRQQPVD
jgi:transposase